MMKFRKNISLFALTICLGAGLLLLGGEEARAQQFAIKANALNWALCTPDLGVEIVTGEHTSLSISATGHYKPYGMNSTLFLLQPEFRYWFNGRPLTREFVGLTAFATTYDMTFSKKVFDGEAFALGVTGGYVFDLAPRWSLELSGGFGLLFFNQKQMTIHDNYDDNFVEESVRANSWGYKLFPVKLGVTFIYIIK